MFADVAANQEWGGGSCSLKRSVGKPEQRERMDVEKVGSCLVKLRQSGSSMTALFFEPQ